MLSADGVQWAPQTLKIADNGSGSPIVTAGGKEYMVCRYGENPPEGEGGESGMNGRNRNRNDFFGFVLTGRTHSLVPTK